MALLLCFCAPAPAARTVPDDPLFSRAPPLCDSPFRSVSISAPGPARSRVDHQWHDIFASITLRQAPRFLDLYRRLLTGYITRATPEDAESANMAQFMGCPDDILLTLAETSELAQWKAQERQNGTLDMRVLIMRANAIENRIVMSTIAESSTPMLPSLSSSAAADATTTESDVRPMHSSREHNAPTPEQAALQLGHSDAVQSRVGASDAASSSVGPSPPQVATGLPMAMPLSTPSISISPAIGGKNSPIPSQNSQNAIRQVSHVFLHTAMLYLASVANDTNPGSSLLRSEL